MVSLDKNREFYKYPTKAKIKNAVFALSGSSASAPGHFSGKFYQVCWGILGDVVYNMLVFF